MKTLGNKSLSAILAMAINVIWWMEWIGFTILFTTIIVVAIVKKAFALNVPVTFADVTLRQVQPLNKDFPVGILKSTSGNLYLNTNATWLNVIMLLTGFTLFFVVVLMITYQLKTIFSNFKKDIPFNETNISRIRIIAFVLMGYFVVQWMFVTVINQILNSNFRWEHMQLTYNYNFSCLVTGVVLIVVAEIFRQGALLENEQKLTI